ncbi:MAG: NAD(P)H-dependent oxidoreductase subunit E [Chloroflexota bacterium]
MSKKAANTKEAYAELLVRLQAAKAENNGLPEKVLAGVAKSCGLPLHEVYGAATFYSFLGTGPRGKHVIRICKSLPCHLKEYEMVVAAISGEIGIKPGETTPDGRFSFELTNCIGLCDQSPAMLIDDDPHGNLDPKKIARILHGYS